MKKIEFQKIKIEYPSYEDAIFSSFSVKVFYKLNLFDFDFKSLGYDFPDYIECYVISESPTIDPEIPEIEIKFLTKLNKKSESIIYTIFKNCLYEKQKQIFFKIINRKKSFFEDQSLKYIHHLAQNDLENALNRFNELNINLTFKEYVEEFLNNKNVTDILED